MGNYERFLDKANDTLSTYLNELGLYYDSDIEKFIGFTEYEILILEFIERSRGARVELGFTRYFNLLDKNYIFQIPEKKRIYSKQTFGYPKWLYYPRDCKNKTKKVLDTQIDMILLEMLKDIKLYLESRIFVQYPIDEYIKKKYIDDSDELARSNHPKGYSFLDEWYQTKEETELESWTFILADDEYEYTSTKREDILPFEQYKAEALEKLESNKRVHQDEAKKYLSKYIDSQLIITNRKHYKMEEFLEGQIGKKLVSEFKKLYFHQTESISAKSEGKVLFYNLELKKEIYLNIFDGIYWFLSHSVTDEYGLPRVLILGCVEEKYFSYGCSIYDLEHGGTQVETVLDKLKMQLHLDGD